MSSLEGLAKKASLCKRKNDIFVKGRVRPCKKKESVEERAYEQKENRRKKALRDFNHRSLTRTEKKRRRRRTTKPQAGLATGVLDTRTSIFVKKCGGLGEKGRSKKKDPYPTKRIP